MANAEKIAEVVHELAFPVEQYVVFGGACLALRDIREARDVEMFVTSSIMRDLASVATWRSAYFARRNHHLVGEVGGCEVQVFDQWDNDIWQPDINAYLRYPEFVRGIPCMPLAEVRAWKLAAARPKDLRDVELIDAYEPSLST